MLIAACGDVVTTILGGGCSRPCKGRVVTTIALEEDALAGLPASGDDD